MLLKFDYVRRKIIFNLQMLCQVINRLEGMEEGDLHYSTKAEQAELLQKVFFYYCFVKTGKTSK